VVGGKSGGGAPCRADLARLGDREILMRRQALTSTA
jgi:hypothetical protein